LGDTPKTPLEQLEKLKANAAQWREAEQLRHYIEAVEKSAIKNGELGEELKDWISRGRIKADCIAEGLATIESVTGEANPGENLEDFLVKNEVLKARSED